MGTNTTARRRANRAGSVPGGWLETLGLLAAAGAGAQPLLEHAMAAQ